MEPKMILENNSLVCPNCGANRPFLENHRLLQSGKREKKERDIGMVKVIWYPSRGENVWFRAFRFLDGDIETMLEDIYRVLPTMVDDLRRDMETYKAQHRNFMRRKR